MLAVARLVSLTFAGLFAGFLVTVLVLELSMRTVDGSVYTEVRHVELIGLDVLATVLLVPAAVATAIVAVARFRLGGAARWLPVVALLLLASVFVLTFTVNLPINAAQHRLAPTALTPPTPPPPPPGRPTPPPGWAGIRDRWQLAHAVRTVAFVLAFGCLTARDPGAVVR